MFILGRAVASAHPSRTKMEVFGFSAADSFAPGSERAWIQLGPHDPNDGGLVSAKIGFDGLKRGAILPRHLNDSRKRCFAEGLSGLRQSEVLRGNFAFLRAYCRFVSLG